MIFNEYQNDWKIINYRNVDSLVTAEFLHELYDRHIPEINSIRFMHTACFVEGDEFTSWAPAYEWNMLAEVLGKRFIENDNELISYIWEYITKPKERLADIFNTLNRFQYDDVEKAFWLLLNLHSIALGEIYGINLVQLEHALEWAIKQNNKQNKSLISSMEKIETVVVHERKYALMLSIAIDEKRMTLDQAMEKYVQKYEDVSCAYGAKKRVDVEERLQKLLAISVKERQKELSSLLKNETVQKAGDSPLSELASAIAKLRDGNKKLMGKVAGYRRKLMNYISSYYDISSEKFDRYLLSDIYHLIFHKIKVSDKIINERKRLVVFSRSENFLLSQEASNLYERLVISKQGDVDKLYGECASEGNIVGRVRRVDNELDCKKITNDEIMVSRGTDFDLLLGLQECRGVITEEGGILSHASVVSRELSKPCLINVANATGLLQTGDIVELNASSGYVAVKERNVQISLDEMLACGIVKLKDAFDSSVYGNKASNLALCMKNEINVLPGYVINADYDILPDTARSIINAFRKQEGWFGHLLVRSSSTLEDGRKRSFAGAFDSEISKMDEEKLTEKLKEVKHSLDAITYTSGYNGKMGILIQPYIKQDIGGVAFSKNPVSGKKEIVLEYSKFGAMDITQGGKSERNIIQYDENIREGWKKKLVKEMIRLEHLFYTPVDVEWGMLDSKIYIFQVRPITT